MKDGVNGRRTSAPNDCPENTDPSSKTSVQMRSVRFDTPDVPPIPPPTSRFTWLLVWVNCEKERAHGAAPSLAPELGRLAAWGEAGERGAMAVANVFKAR
eukprot:607425-Rhodomonas_salina.3